jgi:hypothetical protein
MREEKEFMRSKWPRRRNRSPSSKKFYRSSLFVKFNLRPQLLLKLRTENKREIKRLLLLIT